MNKSYYKVIKHGDFEITVESRDLFLITYDDDNRHEDDRERKSIHLSFHLNNDDIINLRDLLNEVILEEKVVKEDDKWIEEWERDMKNKEGDNG
jgi:hypothetical protein